MLSEVRCTQRKPANCATPPGAALVLLPHQDDEFGVFALLDRNVREGVTTLCVYLTDGGGNNVPPARRDAESRAVLKKIGIADEHILVVELADSVRARDGLLVDALLPTLNALLQMLKDVPIDVVYTPAWEGGHPDHDAAALIAAAFTTEREIEEIWQFSLYNSYRARRFPFKVFNPIPTAGDITEIPLSTSDTIRYVRYCLTYRSQVKTFAALLPLVAYRLVKDRHQSLQRVSSSQFCGKPHQGRLLYERRNWLSWTDFESRAASLIARVAGLLT